MARSEDPTAQEAMDDKCVHFWGWVGKTFEGALIGFYVCGICSEVCGQNSEVNNGQ